MNSFISYAFLKGPCTAGSSEHCIFDRKKFVPRKVCIGFCKNILIWTSQWHALGTIMLGSWARRRAWKVPVCSRWGLQCWQLPGHASGMFLGWVGSSGSDGCSVSVLFPGQRPGKSMVGLPSLGNQTVPAHCGKTSPPAALQMSITQCQGGEGQLSWSPKAEEERGMHWHCCAEEEERGLGQQAEHRLVHQFLPLDKWCQSVVPQQRLSAHF